MRLFFAGGLMTYRALFGWLSPWIYIPTMLIAPLFQVLLFVFAGRTAGVEDDRFYLIGNAVQYSAIPCLFAMGHAISGERWNKTLSIIFASPAQRTLVFLGRMLPVAVNGWFVSCFTLVLGSILLAETFDASVLAGLAFSVLLASLSCTGLGLVMGAVALRVRSAVLLNNVVFGFLLLISGANIAVSSLPPFVGWISHVVPLTHAIAAARLIADGRSMVSVVGALASEATIAVLYSALGLVLVRLMERSARRQATLDLE